MQDELSQLQETEGTQHADGMKIDTNEHSKEAPPSTAGRTLNKTWATGENPLGEGHSKLALATNDSPILDRWLNESMREQPWHGIGRVPKLPPSKKVSMTRGETNSNSAVAGSEKLKSSESEM